MAKNKKSNKPVKLNMDEIQAAAERIAEDYAAFLDYIGNNTVKLAVRTMRLGKKDCFGINSLLHCAPEIWKEEGHRQDQYAEIDYFYYFSISCGILRSFKKGGSFLVETAEKKEEFLELNCLQRYGIMLVYLFGHYLFEGSSKSSFDDFSSVLLRSQYMPVDYSKYVDMRIYKEIYLALPRLFSAFGFLDIKWVETLEKNDKNGIDSICLTKQGTDMVQFIHPLKLLPLWECGREEYLFKKLAPLGCCKEEVKAFLEPETVSGDVTYILKVEVGGCMRKIKIGGHETLHELHEVIQKAVDFDNDHMYCFTLGFGRLEKIYYHPYCKEEEFLANEVRLQELQLYEKVKFEYLFDFGDSWRFGITVEKVLPEFTKNAEVIEQKGESPEQYWDEF